MIALCLVVSAFAICFVCGALVERVKSISIWRWRG